MKYIKILSLIFAVIFLTGCFKDLDTIPLDPEDLTSEVLFQDPDNYRRFLARLYAGLAVTGQEGPAGRADISGIDEGFSQYLRGMFYHQELTTDEALIAWNDATIQDFHAQSWTEADGFIYAFYSRIFYQITICNEFIRETSDEKLDERGVSGPLRDEIQIYRAEARFLRALSYWHGLDHFRNVPFVTEEDPIAAFFPRQIEAPELFSYIESELLAIESELRAPKSNEYGRADQAAAWMVLAKLYQNAEVYIGQNRHADCITMSEKIINSAYSLDPNYNHLFLADNHNSPEIIFPVAFDGINTLTYGGTTFMIFASIGGTNMTNRALQDFGVQGGWAGLRTTPEFYNIFPAGTGGGVISAPNPGQTAQYKKLYVPGSHQGNNPQDLNNSLSEVPGSPNVYEGHIYFPEPNSTIRFYTIPSPTAPPFAIFGSDANDGTLQQNGGLLTIPEAGLHYIRANIGSLTYTIEKRDWEIVGTAVPGGSAALEWDPEAKNLVVDLNLQPGEFIFRANGNDNLTLGDSDGNGILTTAEGPITKITDNARHIIRLMVAKPDYTYQINSLSFDRRPLFFTQGQQADIDDISQFTNGIAVAKYRNVTSTGQRGSNSEFVDTDFPMFRLADAYLMAAESAYRLGNTNQAVDYINIVRERAFQGSGGNISANDLNLEYILAERGRELYWECHRRTDLVRFGQFTDGNYLWQWKGGTKDGTTTPSFRNVFPIPSQDRSVNPNLQQNPGY